METIDSKTVLKDILFVHRNVGKSPVAFGLLIFNMILLIIVIFFQPNRYLVISAYFLETLIIGIFNVFKMMTIRIFGPKESEIPNLKCYYLIPFFILHFGIFYFVQLEILLSSGKILDKLYPMQGSFIPNPFQFFRVTLGKEGIYIISAILLAQLFAFIYGFILQQEYKVVNCLRQAMQPYGRIILQQFVVLIGGFFIILINNAVVFSILLIIIKTLVDLYSSNKHSNNIFKILEEKATSDLNKTS
jgi:hypothetical protein